MTNSTKSLSPFFIDQALNKRAKNIAKGIFIKGEGDHI
jgi:hypothetical protein